MHMGTALRKATDSFRRMHSHIPKGAKICSQCRKPPNSAKSTNSSATTSIENEAFSEDAMDVDPLNGNNHHNDLDNREKSIREMDLEQIFQTLRDKYHSLDANVFMKTQILKLASEN